jgi:FAD/FMN-containing dehydrogenase|tara:strand:- start:577 stop:765 length:189 start_codon:yes stop_codon:yes gene_type:complete
LTEACYDHGGKPYLYGHSFLTEEQLTTHFGRDTIQEWGQIKRELDPNGLLNMGVIPNLDQLS